MERDRWNISRVGGHSHKVKKLRLYVRTLFRAGVTPVDIGVLADRPDVGGGAR